TGGAAVEYGSGMISQIGDGTTNSGVLSLNGANAFMEVGATTSSSALAGLGLVASNGQLVLANGPTVSTTGALTNNGFIEVASGRAATTLSVGGKLTAGTSSSLDLFGGGTAGLTAVVNVAGTFNTSSGANITLDG